MAKKDNAYYFYLFRCKDESLYSGITKDVKKREWQHNSGQGSKYVKSRGGGKMVYMEKHPNKGSALAREIEVKKWPKARKEELTKLKQDKL